MNMQTLEQKLTTINENIKNACINCYSTFDKLKDKKPYTHDKDIGLLKRKLKKINNLINTITLSKIKGKWNQEKLDTLATKVEVEKIPQTDIEEATKNLNIQRKTLRKKLNTKIKVIKIIK
jgi:ribosome-binding protein aMBF1 (putative translation factor)